MSHGDRIVVRGLRLWAHVGVLAFERERGQWFELDLELGVDLAACGRSDQLADTLDYGTLISSLQRQARQIHCHTLEHYGQCILELIAARHGPLPVQLELRKCAAPVPGFTGSVAIRRASGSRAPRVDGPGPSS
ncbi:dihydroneopterin aldolase [Cyanobium sp. ATX 6A2]|uniref:dihydroneopterin aldolase n=1 Tax=Cyanobium sp. ATX 6A2 TaxID=2823700 RepID=UPI0020CCC73F|nr:dihydroneopterin aldolase [Cyanobium sp. ATX 6A2]MCP9888812.1 dihydroneopterin aldolase [Cyanobium sp. ATX 6A2]